MILKGGFVTGTGQTHPVSRTADGPSAAAAGAGHGDADADPHDHAEIKAGELDDYIVGQLFRRLETEPQFLARCAAVLDETELDENLAEELEELESDPCILLSVLRASRAAWPQLDPSAQRLIIIYAIDRVMVGPPSDSIDEQVDICWRAGQP
jgi:hypothetical protein